MARKTYTNSEVQLREQLTSITVDDHGAKIPLSTEYIQQHMYVAVVNTEMNSKTLVRCPHKKITNLSVIVKCDLGEDRSLWVTNEFVPVFQKSAEEIIEQAKANSIKEGFTFREMRQVIQNAFSNDTPMQNHISEMWDAAEALDIYVITTPRGFDGASVIVSRDFMKDVYEKFGEAFYILPASRHEVLALPVSKASTEIAEFAAIMSSINATEEEPRDWLSDDVYCFDGRSLKLVDSFIEKEDDSIASQQYEDQDMRFENIYRTYIQVQKYRKDTLISEEELKEKLRTLKPGEMVSLTVMRGDDHNERRENL